MTEMNDTTQTIVATTTVSTVFLILAIILILVRSRTLETKLLLIGIFMAIAASVQANVLGVSVGANAAQVALSGGFGSATLMKIAVILTLVGAGMMLLSRVAPPATPGTETEGPHVD